jgi:hypothetical protein
LLLLLKGSRNSSRLFRDTAICLSKCNYLLLLLLLLLLLDTLLLCPENLMLCCGIVYNICLLQLGQKRQHLFLAISVPHIMITGKFHIFILNKCLCSFLVELFLLL